MRQTWYYFWEKLVIRSSEVKWSEVIRWWHSLVLLCYEIWHLVSWLLNDCLSWVNTTFVMRFTFTLVCFAKLWVWFALAKYGSLCFTFTRVSFTGGPTIQSLLLCCTQELNGCYMIFWIESIQYNSQQYGGPLLFRLSNLPQHSIRNRLLNQDFSWNIKTYTVYANIAVVMSVERKTKRWQKTYNFRW